jgi:hypothetical protein
MFSARSFEILSASTERRPKNIPGSFGKSPDPHTFAAFEKSAKNDTFTNESHPVAESYTAPPSTEIVVSLPRLGSSGCCPPTPQPAFQKGKKL